MSDQWRILAHARQFSEHQDRERRRHLEAMLANEGSVIGPDATPLELAADHAVGSVLSLLAQCPCRSDEDRSFLRAILGDLRRERGRIVAGAARTVEDGQ